MEKKYQIFISSTYSDLKEERGLVIKSVLEMGHIPLGMEMFSAGDEEQWKLIKKQIDDCDYYVVIVAHRYGSMDGEISYTEKEYDYATSIGIPTLGFVINDDVNWNLKKVDKTVTTVEKLNGFKDKIKNKLISFWDDKNDLYGKVSISLMKQFNTNPRTGWVRTTEDSSPEILREISRLSGENAQLREELEKFLTIRDEKEKLNKLIDTLKHNKRGLSFSYLYVGGWQDRTEISLFEIFNLIAPELVIENSTYNCAHLMGISFKPDKERSVRKNWPCPSNVVRRIFADLNVLDLLAPSSKKHSVKDKNEYWTLTAEGKTVFKEVRREILEKNLQTGLLEMEEEDEQEVGAKKKGAKENDSKGKDTKGKGTKVKDANK